jgi:transposase
MLRLFAVDLAKEVFELAFADADYRIVQSKRLSRRTFAQALENRGPLRVVMEACGSANYWARRFRAPTFRSRTPSSCAC